MLVIRRAVPAAGNDEAAGGCGGKQQFSSQKQGLAVSARTPRVDGRKEEHSPTGDSLTFGFWQVLLIYLEVGGRYKIPKKPRKETCCFDMITGTTSSTGTSLLTAPSRGVSTP